jgi:hypothetical protein
LTYPNPVEARVAVHRVVVGDEPGRRGGGGEPGARHAEEGAEEDEAVEVDLAPHGGEAEDAGAALEAHQEGLGLVLEAVGGEEPGGARLPRRLDQEPVARAAGGGFDAGRGFRPGPGEDADGEPAITGNRGDVGGDRVGAVRQAMIDGEDEDGGAAWDLPPAVDGGEQGE